MAKKPEPSFQNVDTLRMFPSWVWKAALDPAVSTPLNEAIVRALAGIGAPLDGLTPGESWQSGHDLNERAEFATLVNYIEAGAAAAVEHLRADAQGLRITGCWANVNAPGAGHRVHSHPNNYLSGIYYVRVRDGADAVNFHDPRPQAGILRPPVRALTADNADQIAVKIKDGEMLMFPAWLQHSVDANRSGRLRISIAFNLMFAASDEVMGRPMWRGGRRRPRAAARRRSHRGTASEGANAG